MFRPIPIPILGMAALTLVGPTRALGQSEASVPIHAAVELALGTVAVGQGPGVSDMAAVRVHRGGWGLRLRMRGWDGDRRHQTSCWWYCDPTESFSENAILLERGVTVSPGMKLFLSAGPGHLSGRRFQGATTNLESLSKGVFAFGLSSHLSITRMLQFTPALVGHAGPDGTAVALAFGLALGY